MYFPVYACFGIAFLLSTPAILRSQNLVKNPGFEEFSKCPERLGNFDADAVSWTSPTSASTDYFHACSPEMGTPENFNGRQEPESGKGYAGLYLFAPGDYREYVQGELVQALEEGKEYQIRFSVSLAERSDFAINEFQAVLVRNPISRETKKVLSKSHLYREPDNTLTFAEIPGEGYYDDTIRWITLSSRFIAQGGERFLILGNFRENRATRVRETGRNAKHGAYYYLDQVGVYSLPGGQDDTFATQHQSGTGSENISGVLFGSDDHRLTDAAKQEIKNLYTYLRDHPGLRVSVEGHTDSRGSAGYNLRLSELRCLAVMGYLQELGLPVARMDRMPHGLQHPAADNETEAGRQQNRRVVFRILTPEP